MKTITTLIYHAARKILKQRQQDDNNYHIPLLAIGSDSPVRYGQHKGIRRPSGLRSTLRMTTKAIITAGTIAVTTAVLLFTAQACLNLPDPIAEMKNVDDMATVSVEQWNVVDDDNKDHAVQPGENITLQVVLNNKGNNTLKNVKATLNTNNSYVFNISTTNIGFGNILPNSNSTAQENFTFSVNTSTPINTIITFIANVTDDNGNKWETTFNVTVQQDISQGDYHDHDEEKLRNFLKQNSNTTGQTNGHILGLSTNDMNDWENNESWISKVQGVTWTNNTPKRISTLSTWYYKKLAGNLDLQGCNTLTDLHCSDNQLTQLNVSNCTRLTKLSCWNNQLTQMEITNCTALAELYCYSNQLTQLDVTHCTKLTWLDCKSNQLNTLDVHNCTALTRLICENNQFNTLDVTNCTALTGLDCSNNQLNTLDVHNNTALTSLNCSNNQINILDVSKCTRLIYLYCYDNPINSINVGWTILPTLESLYLPDDLTNATLYVPQGTKQLYNNTTPWNNFGIISEGINDHNPIVNEQYHEHDKIILRDFLKQNSNALKLGLTNDDINQWDDNELWISKIQGVTWNDNNPKQITDINWNSTGIAGNMDLSDCNELVNLSLHLNQLTTLNLNNCYKLQLVHCFNNQLTNINLINCSNLKMLTCDNNPLQTVYVNWNTPPNIELRLPDILTNATLFVPQGTKSLYQNTTTWSKFGYVQEW